MALVKTLRTPRIERGSDGARRVLQSLDRFDLVALVALAGLSLVILAVLLTKGRPLSGADGAFAHDQLQYFTWIREFADHGLVGNQYDLAPDNRVFLHPGFLLSGLLVAAFGLSVPLSYLLWKPVAVVALFAGTLLYVRRLLASTGQRRAALVLALFSVMPASAFVAWTDWGGPRRQFTFDFISGEMWTGQYLLGYLMTGLAVGLMPLVLLSVESWRKKPRGSMLAWAAVSGLLVAWLQPWQGVTLACIVVTVEALRLLRGRGRPALALALVPLAIAVPLVYYFVLGETDDSWRLASEINAAGTFPEWSWPWWAIVLTLLPLAAPAALAYRLPASSWQEQAVRVWPFVALAVYLAPVGTFPYHAFQGLAIPLSILAVQGLASVWRRPRRAVVVAALALMVLPGLAHKMQVFANSIRTAGDPYYILAEEQSALDALEREGRPGGVLSAGYAGSMIPFKTGREVYVGALSWTPNWRTRQRLGDRLFEGEMGAAEARALVRSVPVSFLYGDCRPGIVDLSDELRPLLAEVKRFGCARLYVLREKR
jgi:hypothetical protein